MLGTKKIIMSVFVTTLVGCGGGGGSSNDGTHFNISENDKKSTGTDTKPSPGLYLSEIAGNDRLVKNFYNNTSENGVSWVELFNNQPVPVKLKDYILTTGGLKLNDRNVIQDSVDFNLPDITIPANGYVVIAGQTSEYLKNSEVDPAHQVIYILDKSKQFLPYWKNESGFIELKKVVNSKFETVDFVRFGSNNTTPTTPEYWTGANVPALKSPSKNYVGSQSLDPLDTHEQSIVRLTKDFKTSKSQSDWTLVNFPTSGGPNDVDANAKDSDGDGIPDSAKVKGGTYAGLDLYSMGARPGQKDIFIQMDYMGDNPTASEQDSMLALQKNAFDKIVDAFKRKNFTVHFDLGTLFSAQNTIDPANFNLSGTSIEREFSKCLQMSGSVSNSNTQIDSGCTSIYEYYTKNVDPRRRAMFRYGLNGSTKDPNGSAGSSGEAELPGNKIIVTMQGFLPTNLNSFGERVREDWQSATIMHEFGHTFGLKHGGGDLINNKPNYLSIMNYSYQLTGVPDGLDDDAIEKYYYHENNTNSKIVPNTSTSPISTYQPNTFDLSKLKKGPGKDGFRLDFSDGTGLSLDENNLNELTYVGRGQGTEVNAFGDWNLNGTKDASPYRWSLTNQTRSGRPIFSIIEDFNDWANLILVTGKDFNRLNGTTASYGKLFKNKPTVSESYIQSEPRISKSLLNSFKNATSK